MMLLIFSGSYAPTSLRSTVSSNQSPSAVEKRIEGWIVVHLQLAVHLEQLASREYVIEQLDERLGKISVLQPAPREPLLDFRRMERIDVLALGLLLEMKNSQGHDR